MNNRRYKGQVSAWWWVVTALSAVVLVLYLVNIASDGVDFPAALATIPGLAVVAVVALLVWIALDNYAELHESSLYIRIGPLRMTIPYDKISSVETYRLASDGAVIALALGRDRVTIRRRGSASVVVSVENRDAFVAELRRRG